MAQIEVRKIQNKRDLKAFIRLPWAIYNGNPNWVPPLIADVKKILDKSSHPFYKHSDAEFFIAHQNGKVVGRIAAIENRRHNKFHKENIAFFGFYEAFDDVEITRALMGKVEEWARERKFTALRGPMNPSTNDSVGMLLKGFDSPPRILMPYNPSYYNTQMEEAGYRKCEDLFAYKMHTYEKLNPAIRSLAESVRSKPNICVRSIDLKNFWQEAEIIKTIYNDAWVSNWGFVPLTDDEFRFIAKELKQIIDPEYALILEVDKVPVAFALSLPDINQALIKINGRLLPFGLLKLLYHSRNIDILRIWGLGIIKEMQHKRGLAPLLYTETYNRAERNGISFGEFSWILESNIPMNAAARNMGGKVYKSYRIYEKGLI